MNWKRSDQKPLGTSRNSRNFAESCLRTQSSDSVIESGERLYRAGEDFSHLYYVKTGALKSVVLLPDPQGRPTSVLVQPSISPA